MSRIINNHSNPELMKALHQALNRALNTWEGAHPELIKICDDFEAGRITGVTFFTGTPSETKIDPQQ